jgi:hypothetical protein
VVLLVAARASRLQIGQILRPALGSVFNVVAVHGFFRDAPIAAGFLAESPAAFPNFVAPQAHVFAGKELPAIARNETPRIEKTSRCGR